MGVGGFYGGLFPIVMINALIARLTSIVFVFNDFLTMLGLKRSNPLHLQGETTELLWAASDEADQNMDKIRHEIRDSLTSSPFAFPAEKSLCKMCAVCLSEFELNESIFLLPHCFHIFHETCLFQWLDRHQTTCPLCRTSFLTEELANKVSDQEEEIADPWCCGSHD